MANGLKGNIRLEAVSCLIMLLKLCFPTLHLPYGHQYSLFELLLLLVAQGCYAHIVIADYTFYNFAYVMIACHLSVFFLRRSDSPHVLSFSYLKINIFDI